MQVNIFFSSASSSSSFSCFSFRLPFLHLPLLFFFLFLPFHISFLLLSFVFLILFFQLSHKFSYSSSPVCLPLLLPLLPVSSASSFSSLSSSSSCVRVIHAPAHLFLVFFLFLHYSSSFQRPPTLPLPLLTLPFLSFMLLPPELGSLGGGLNKKRPTSCGSMKLWTKRSGVTRWAARWGCVSVTLKGISEDSSCLWL